MPKAKEHLVTYTNLIQVPSNINPGLTPARQATMLAVFGQPRTDYSQSCQEVTNPQLQALIATVDVGPCRARGLRPALDDLIAIFKDVLTQHPAIYAAINSAGMLCVRYVRGSNSYISNHSWGTAIDLYLDAAADVRGDNKVLQGLADIADIFNQHGWYWGAGFGTEDAMHFEASDQRIRQYQSEGKLGSYNHVDDDNLGQGDRGPEVKSLQARLSQLGFATAVDGAFGPLTQAALRAFQAKEALRQTGIFDHDTQTAMSEAEGRVKPPQPSVPPASVACPILGRGSVGPEVQEWQTFLAKKGFAQVSAEAGTLGLETDKATRAFQTEQGLAADGVVGPKTRAAAGSAAPVKPQGGTPALRRLRNSELTGDIIRQAPLLLRAHFKEPIGTQIPFTSDGKSLVGVLEWHYNERMGKHKGFSVFVSA
jgi:peptidoglycan hydrolase-like protein with peptidoglycan-binding domain